MVGRTSLLFVSLLGASCACASKPAPPPVTMPAPVAAVGWVDGAEIHVRLNRELGPTRTPSGTRFTATVVESLVDPRGIVVIPAGALVHGHVVGVDEPGRRIEIVFTGLETRHAKFALRARVLQVWPYALTVRPDREAGPPVAVLQATAPIAVGGGPPADGEEPVTSDTVVPFDAEMRLMVVAPLILTTEPIPVD